MANRSEAIDRLKMLLDPQFGEDQRAYSDLPKLDQSSFEVETGKGLPKVKIPGQFRPYPSVSGSPQLHSAVRGLMNVMPSLQGQVTEISEMPNSPSIGMALDSEFPVERLANSNLLGATNTKNKKIWINPRNDLEPLESTLLHEMGHMVGHRHGSEEIEELELIGKEMMNPSAPDYIGPTFWNKVRK